MKKTLTVIILILAVAFFLLNSRLGLIHCNMRKDYKSMNERYFEGIRNRIADLEKEPVKDATTVRRLAEQYNLMGNYYIKNSLWDMAIEAYRNSIRYGSNTADIYYSLGLAYGNRGAEKKSSGDIDQAEICYTKALELDPSHHESRYGLAIILFITGRGRGRRLLSWWMRSPRKAASSTRPDSPGADSTTRWGTRKKPSPYTRIWSRSWSGSHPPALTMSTSSSAGRISKEFGWSFQENESQGLTGLVSTSSQFNTSVSAGVVSDYSPCAMPAFIPHSLYGIKSGKSVAFNDSFSLLSTVL
jgi:hypothetical protein